MPSDLPIDDVDEIDPTVKATAGQVYQSLDDVTKEAADVDAAIAEKAKNNDILGALKIATGFIKTLLPMAIP